MRGTSALAGALVLCAGCNAILGLGDVKTGVGGIDGGLDGPPGPDAPPGQRPSFAAPVAVPSAPGFNGLYAADINNDGRPDVVGPHVAPADTSELVSMVSAGNGTLSAGPTVPGHSQSGARASGMAAQDLDHEGSTDFVIANGEGRDVTVAFGPSFATRMSYASKSTGVGCAVTALRLVEFTGDSNPDIVATTNCLYGIELFAGTGGGGFAAAADQTFTTAGVIQAFAVGDLDHDGHQDVVVGEIGQLDVVRGGGGGMVGASVPITTATQYPFPLVIADIDGDGKLDLIFDENDRSKIAVMRGNGDATFRAAQETVLPTAGTTFAVADLDGDGKLDLAVGAAGPLYILRGNGDGTFAAPQTIDSKMSFINDLLVIDLDHDLKPDLVLGDTPLTILRNTTP